MRRCSVCGKVISDFSMVCPYCRSTVSTSSYDAKSIKKKEYYTKRTTKKRVIISLILSVIVLLLFGGPFIIMEFYFGPYLMANFVDFAIELVCSAYGLFVIIKHKPSRVRL